MTDWIALHGPIGSGKTTLAKALEKQGYLMIDFVGLLKQKCIQALSPYVSVSLEQIAADKENYRSFIQEFGRLIDYPGKPDYIFEALEHWFGQPVVFDNIRSVQQAETLSRIGFDVVALYCSPEVRRERVPGQQPDAQSHPIETPLPMKYIDVLLDGTKPVEALVNQVMSL